MNLTEKVMFLESRNKAADFLRGHSLFTDINYLADFSQYFEHRGYLFQDIAPTENTTHGSNFCLQTLTLFLIYPYFIP
jgi:hypothetical protein